MTGAAGSGRASALRVLEDLDFYCIDNLPVALALSAVRMATERYPDLIGVALGVDPRERLFFQMWPQAFNALASEGFAPEIIYLDAADEVLVRRYSETRRPHPLGSGDTNIVESIRRERLLLAEMRERATRIIDTTALSIHELRGLITALVLGADRQDGMAIDLISFGYKYGTPVGLDIVQDVRFVPNPFFVEELRPLSGLDPKVSDYVLAQPSAQRFLELFEGLIKALLPYYRQEQRSYLSIGIGCTGGRHRSPALAVALQGRLAGGGIEVGLRHLHLGERAT